MCASCCRMFRGRKKPKAVGNKELWFIKREDGNDQVIQGPHDTPQMRDFMLSGEISGKTLIRKDDPDGEFLMVQEMFPNVHLAFCMKPRDLTFVRKSTAPETRWPASATVEDSKVAEVSQQPVRKKTWFAGPDAFEKFDDEVDAPKEDNEDSPQTPEQCLVKIQALARGRMTRKSLAAIKSAKENARTESGDPARMEFSDQTFIKIKAQGANPGDEPKEKIIKLRGQGPTAGVASPPAASPVTPDHSSV